jgi:hypothetical protein
LGVINYESMVGTGSSEFCLMIASSGGRTPVYAPFPKMYKKSMLYFLQLTKGAETISR